MSRHSGFAGVLVVLSLAAGGTATLGQEPPAEERPLSGEGAWLKKAFSVSGGGACRQVWSCGPADPIEVKETVGERLVFLADQETDGTCRATDETPCRSCNAPEPAQACTWQIKTDAQ